MKKLFIAFTLLCEFFNAQNPAFQWAKSFDPTSYGNFGIDITGDNSGNTYAVGTLSTSVDFDPGPSVYTLTSNGYWDVFVIKLDQTGNLIWAKSLGGIDDDYPNSVVCDAQKNVYIGGYFTGTVDFDPGVSTYTLNANNDYIDAFVLKLDSSGNFVWAKQFGGAGEEHAGKLKIDAAGDLYIIGDFDGPGDFDPGPATYTLANSGSIDGFVCKINSSGNFMWANGFGSTGWDNCLSIAIDNVGDVVVSGYFTYTLDFDPGPSTYTLNPSSGVGREEAFVLKLNGAGDFIWVKSFGGTLDDEAMSVSIDPTNNIFSSGYIQGNADLDPSSSSYTVTSLGSSDIFISKLDPAGNFLWGGIVGGQIGENSTGIASDASGSVLLFADGNGIMDVDLSANVYTINLSGSTFISKYDPLGNLDWINILGGTTGIISPDGLDLKNDGSLYLTGIFHLSPDFDIGPGTFTLTSSSYNSIFAMKMSGCCTDILEKTLERDYCYIYPNPFNKEFDIRLQKNSSVEITNMYGEIVWSSKSTNRELIDLGNNPNGIYFVSIQNDQRKGFFKIIKQ